MSAYTGGELALWAGAAWEPREPRVTGGISKDSRTTARGDVYVALSGPRFDGHDFVGPAFDKGACGAVVRGDYPLPATPERPLLRVRDPLEALRAMAAGFLREVAPEVIAVTGSAGKTTVKEMIAEVLCRAGRTARSPGNWNNDIGLPLSILSMERSAELGVFEIGMNHPGELGPLCGLLRPSWGVVTNVGPVHMHAFDSVEAVADEKASLLRSLPADGVAFLNLDGGCYDLLSAAAPCRKVVVSTTGGPADYVLRERSASEGTGRIEETQSGETKAIRCPLPGEHNLANALFAVAAGRAHGLDWEPIAEAISRCPALDMHWERRTVGGVHVINDGYNANPLSACAAVRTFAVQEGSDRKWLVLAGMLELGARATQEHRALGRLVGEGDWQGLVAVGDLGSAVADGAEEAGMPADRVIRCADNLEAATRLDERVLPGDSVLFKGSRGMHVEEILEAFVKQHNRQSNVRRDRHGAARIHGERRLVGDGAGS
ncbi:UDP-N-acetylmuramoyl-tripeptide--D-alanyl-D-alanine ligase [Verrucomicrobiota bacterium]